MIQGDTEALHGDVLAILDLVRSGGIQKVTFQSRADTREGGIIGEPESQPTDPSSSARKSKER
jgi:hypothetical protein